MALLLIDQMIARTSSSRDDSDVSFFYDLISLGEMITKLTALFLISNIEDDIDRTKYRYEYLLVRADGIGEYSNTINSVITGSTADLLSHPVRDNEMSELASKAKENTWQRDALSKLNKCLIQLKISANDLTNKSSLLIWYSNFAILRNKTKGHGSITAAQCASVNQDLYDSIIAIYNNLTLFKRPWAYLYQNYSGKYRISYISEKSSDFDNLKRKNDYTLNNGVYCFTDRPHAITLCYSNPELSYFFLVNGNFSNTNQFEVLNYLTNDKEKKDGTAYLVPPTRLPDSMTSGSPQLNLIGNSFSNLPIGLTDYIKRNELEDELKKVLLEKERYPIVTLKGRGGIGKTSLAIHVIDEIINTFPNRFQVIVWFSARDVDLMVEGPKQVQAVVANQKDISIEYFNQIGEKKSKKTVIDDFSKELTHNNIGDALYIFDNFETLSNPIEVFEWLDSYIRLPNKILITSRLSRNFKADYPVEVKGMNEDQCRSLIFNTASRFGIQELLTEEYIDNLIEESDGHPYIIKIILGEVAKKRKISEIKRVVADKDKVLDALFKRTYSTLSKSGKRIFLTLCSWRSVIPQIALESVILREENEKIDVDNGIDELHKCSFIEISERKDDSFIYVPLAAALYGARELEVSPEKPIILQDKKLLMEFGAGTERGKMTLIAHIEKKIKFVFNRVDSVEKLEEEIPSLECLSAKYPYIWKYIAELYHKFNLLEQAKGAYRELLKVIHDEQQKLFYWKELAMLCRDDNDWSGESSALTEIVDMTNVPFSEISYAAYRINKFYSETSDADNLKTYMIEKVINTMEKRIDEANAIDCSRIAWLCLNMQDETRALKYAKYGLELDNNNLHCQNLVNKLSLL